MDTALEASGDVLWDAIRFAVDQGGESGQFILTGSAVPKDNAVQHTGTGCISRMLIHPMSYLNRWNRMARFL